MVDSYNSTQLALVHVMVAEKRFLWTPTTMTGCPEDTLAGIPKYWIAIPQSPTLVQ